MGKSWNSGDIHKMAFYAAMHTKEAAGRQVSQARIGANRILNLKAFLQIAILSENQDRIAFFKAGFRLDGEIQGAVSTDGNDVDAVFFPDIDLTYAHTDPAFRKIYLIDIVVAFQIDKIKNVVGTEADRSPFRKLLFRVDDLIGTVPQMCIRDRPTSRQFPTASSMDLSSRQTLCLRRQFRTAISTLSRTNKMWSLPRVC